MNHYFTNDETLDHDEKTISETFEGVSFSFATDAGVFSKDKLDDGSRLLLESVVVKECDRILIDMGCGYGPIGLILAKINPQLHCFLYDINRRAIALAQKNQVTNGISNVDIVTSNLFEKVSVKADIIVTNPPIRAGKKVVFKLYEDAREHLLECGVFYVVIRKKQGAPSSLDYLKTLFEDVSVINKRKGYWIIRSTMGR
jgi:16S rRNA (guanine1207-N2)-methyltransferase